MLQRLREASGKDIWIELGLQSTHEATAERIHRGYPLAVFDAAYRRLKAAGFTVIVHVILGFPWETDDDMLATIRYLSALNPHLDGIKLQLLHVLRGTELGRMYEAEPFRTLSLDEYCALVVKCLRLLPPDTVIHRITGDGPKRLLLAPLWSADKKKVLNTLNRAIHAACQSNTREVMGSARLPKGSWGGPRGSDPLASRQRMRHTSSTLRMLSSTLRLRSS